MSEDSTPANSRERRHGPANAMLLAFSVLLHVLALEVLLLATAGGGARGRGEQPIDAVFLPTAAGGGAAAPALSAAERKAAKERQAMLDRLVQPAGIPDTPGALDTPDSPSTTGGQDAGAKAPPTTGAPDGAGLPADAGGDVSRPEVIESSRILPDYPEAAQRAGREGVVVIKAVIDEQGKVTNPQILRSLDPILDEVALAAVRRWRFRPAIRLGKPVRVNYILTVDFRL
jgi:TonB family protein